VRIRPRGLKHRVLIRSVQLRVRPTRSISIASATRRARVSSRLASATQRANPFGGCRRARRTSRRRRRRPPARRRARPGHRPRAGRDRGRRRRPRCHPPLHGLLADLTAHAEQVLATHPAHTPSPRVAVDGRHDRECAGALADLDHLLVTEHHGGRGSARLKRGREADRTHGQILGTRPRSALPIG
jgi:hypothetical protein